MLNREGRHAANDARDLSTDMTIGMALPRTPKEHANVFALKSIDHPVKPARTWLRWLGSLRVQLLLCLTIGVLLPTLQFAHGDLSMLSANEAMGISAMVAALATIVGVSAARKIASFPGVVGASYIFPALAISFGVGLAIILFVRAPYSGTLLLTAFLCVLVTRFSIGALESRHDTNRYYLVPGGDIERIRDELEAAYVVLAEPLLPKDPSAIIVADLHHDHLPEWERAFAAAALNGIAVHHYKQVWEARTGMVRIEHLSENNFGSLIPSNPYVEVKRPVDIVLTIIALPLLIVPLAITALLVRLDSPGPVFFRQERIGYRGRAFSVVKFRTMRVAEPLAAGADRVSDAITKDDDNRITRIGRFLRKTRIDELPQIYNILRGEMSWIGPRPEARPLSEWYEREIPFYSYRHIVRPGITGWAQVNQGHVASISEVHNKLRLDFYYIKNFSMWIDLMILFKTVAVVIKGSGAK